jgi:hypothetical protein
MIATNVKRDAICLCGGKTIRYDKELRKHQIDIPNLGFIVASRLLGVRHSFPHLYQDFIEGDP